MSPQSWELIFLLAGVVFSGFFSGAEAALVSLSVNRTKQLIEKGGARGKALEFLSFNSNEILTTILVGNNFVNIYVAGLATTISQRLFSNDALSISVGVTTLVILIFGEIIPKTFARSRAENLALPIIRILQLFYYLLWPFIKMFMLIINAVLGDSAQLRGRIVTQNDIEFMVNQAEEKKSIDSKQIDLLNSILEFPRIKVKDIMTPRNKVHSVSLDAQFDEVVALVREVQHSRYPVFENELDNIQGFLHVKDLSFVTTEERDGSFRVEKYLNSAFFIHEHMKIQAVFDYMNRKKVHLAMVKDENEMVVGIITLEDIMEEIFGEIQDEHDDEDISAAGLDEVDLDQGIEVEADINLRDLASEYEIKIPLSDNYSNLRGFLLEQLGNHFPEKDNMIFGEGYSFKLAKVSDNSIEQVFIQKVTNNELSESDDSLELN